MTPRVLPMPTPSAHLTTVDKRSAISRKELIAEYIKPGIPVVLTDAAAQWGALGKFTPEYFKSNYGHLTKEIKGKTYTLAEVVDIIRKPTPGVPVPYPFCLDVDKAFPELMHDFKPQVDLGKPDRVQHPFLSKLMLLNTVVNEIFLGGAGSCFPYLHVDALFLHTQITQLYGAKDFILYSPDQTPYMYPKADNTKVSEVDIFNPDYEKHPLFRHAQPVRVTVEEGESILFPTKWWHTTQIHEPCISIARSYLNEWNWTDFVQDNFELRKKRYPALALAMLAYGKALGGFIQVQEKITAPA